MERIITAEEQKLVSQWYAASESLKAAKTLEADLRLKLVDVLADKTKQEGTETINMPMDWKLRIQKSLNYTLNQNQLDEVIASLHENLCAELFKTKTEIVPAVYKRLDPSTQRYISPALSITSGMPSVKLLPPNSEGDK